MIRLVLVVAFLPLGEASSQTVAAQQAPSGSAAGGRVVLRLSAQTNRANVCTPVWVTATLRSEEEKALTVVQQRTVPAVVLTVTGPDGAPVPRTRYGEALQTMRTETSQSFKQILPGESVEEYILLNQAFDLSLTDGIHTSPAGNMLLGERMARSALGAVYGKPIDYLAPDLRSARKIDNGAGIELTFHPVTNRMESIDPTANCFRVDDASGRVEIDGVAYRGDASVRLVLKRQLAGRAVVHGGYGFCPQMVPVDVVRLMPMLGFYGVEVT